MLDCRAVAILLLAAGIGIMPASRPRAADPSSITIPSDTQTEFSLDGKSWSPAVTTWVHPSWPKLDGATWIWRVGKVSKDEAVNGSPIVTFRRKFTLPAGSGNQGTLQITADNAYEASLNGKVIGSNGVLDAASSSDQQWHGFDTYTVALQPGENELIVRAINYHSPLGEAADGETNPGGVVFSLAVAPQEAVCGPDVTAKVFATLAKITSDFNANPSAKDNACPKLYGLTTFNSAWDIKGLDPVTSPGFDENKRPFIPKIPFISATGTGPQAEWDRKTGGWKRTSDGGKFSAWLTGMSNICAIPRPDDACAATVQFIGTCQHAQVVNYIMWGRVNKLCGYSVSDAMEAIIHRGFFSDNDLVQRQLTMTNIGYFANSADEVSSAVLGTLTTPAQFQKCQLKCSVTMSTQPWSYIWTGFRGHED